MSQAQQIQLIHDRVKQGEVAAVPEKDKVLASTNVAKLFFTVYKLLCDDSDEAKQMRAEYYPKVKPGATAKAKTSTEDVEVKAMIEEFVPALEMAYFTGKDANTYAYTTKREEIVFNRYICDAFEEALVKQREPQLSMLKYVILLTSYHELAHACFNGTESRTRLGISATRRSSRTLQACPMRCVCRITRENLGGSSRELKYTARKYKEATGVHLVKYEKNVEKDYLDCKLLTTSLPEPDALKRYSAGFVLTKFQSGTDMDLIDASEHVNIFKLEAIELSVEDLARKKK